MSVELLPEELLMMVLQHLGTRDLLACRRVCKRLWRLVLDPLLWRHKDLDDQASCACPVLRLAPCLRSLHLQQTPLCHRKYTTETKCAVERLVITVRRAAGFRRASSVISNQAALGRLRHVTVELAPWDPPFEVFSHRQGHLTALCAFLQTLVCTPGLHELVISTHPNREFCHLLVSQVLELPAAANLTPSLRRFVCREGKGIRAIGLEVAVLREHAPTLEEVNIGNVRYAQGGYAEAELKISSLLAGMPHLRKLTCCLMLDMAKLAGCSKLSEVTLCVPNSVIPIVMLDFEAFLLEARHLRSLTFEFDNYGRMSATSITRVVARLAASGLSRLESLAMVEKGRKYLYDSDDDYSYIGGEEEEEEGFRTAMLVTPLLKALPLLSNLRRLEVSRMPDELLEGITPVTAPCLRSLVVTMLKGCNCVHDLLHRSEVLALLRNNPLLHVDVSLKGFWGCRDSWLFRCEWCRKQCHANVPDAPRVGFFTHDPKDKCTTLEHNSSDEFSCPHWCHVPLNPS